MDEFHSMQIERACERLAKTYALRIDRYDYDGVMDLWADDGVWAVRGVWFVKSPEMSGKAAIRRGLEDRDPTEICRHLVTNIVVDVIDENRAEGRCYTLNYRVRGVRHDPPGPMQLPQFLVDYRDTFVRHPDRGWLFARRDVTTMLQARADAGS